MTGRTHDLTAFTLLNYLFISTPLTQMSFGTLITSLGSCLIGGIFPDIDQSTANIWNRIPGGSIIGKILSPLLGSHRLISHSFVGIIIIGILGRITLAKVNTIFLVNMDIVWVSFMVGYISHIGIDLFTKEGEPLFFPLPFKIGIPPLHVLRLKTGGLIEKSIVFPSLMIANGYLFYMHYHRYLDFLRLYIK